MVLVPRELAVRLYLFANITFVVGDRRDERHIAVFGDEMAARSRAARIHQGGVWLLERLRLRHPADDANVFALEIECVRIAPQPLHRGDPLIGVRVTICMTERHAAE